MKIKIIKSNPELIQEITEEEYSYLEEALEIPPEKLPFSNIFGDKYRIIDSYGSLSTKNPFGAMIKKLNSWGWNLVDHEGDKAIELYKEYLMTRPDLKAKGGEPLYKSEPKYAKMSLKKLITKMNLFFNKSLPAMYTKATEMKEKHYASIDKAQEQYDDPLLMSPEDIENYKKDLAQIEAKFGIPFKALTAKMKSGANLYFGSGGVYLPNYLMNHQSRSTRELKAELNNFTELIDDDRAMYKIQSNFDNIFEPSYIIYSRHPLDVFRMSDFVQITSCHTPPSKRHLTSLPGKWDDYNICALAEAHANGMIAYAVSPKSFERAGIEPTQDGIDEYEDGELFYDDERVVDGLEPQSRVRIRNTTYTDPKTKQTTKLAVPDQKTYGSPPPNFSKTVRDYTAAAQKEEFDKVFNSDGVEKLEDGEINIPLENFQRFGGSYEDGGATVKDNLPLMFATAVNVPAAKITMPGFLEYDISLQNELESKVDNTDRLENLNAELNDVLERVNGMRFKIMTNIEEDHDGSFYYGSIDLHINIPLPSYMTEIAKDRRREVYDFFKDYEDEYNLHYDGMEKEPRDIMVYPKDSTEAQGLGFDTAFIRITYRNIDELMHDSGVDMDVEQPNEVIQIITDHPEFGGFAVDALSDPYVEDGFQQKTAALLGVSPFGDDPEFYLTKVLNSVLTPDHNAGDWEGFGLDLDYLPSGIEYWEEAAFESTMDLEDDWMLELGLSPEQVGLFVVALNQNKEVQNKVVELIEKYLYPKADSILPMIIETDGATIGAVEVGSDYKKVASIISQAGGDMQTFQFPIKIELVSNEIDTKNKMILLTKILGEFDSDDTLDEALNTSEGHALIRQVIEAASPKSVNENKRRTKIRILRG